MRTISKQLIWMIVLVAVFIAGGEVFARYYLGLGTPPIYVPHPDIEYMYKPNQDVYRFGNHIIVNQYGMRTVPFAAQISNSEYRIMVFGDSVINGGNQTDHNELATTILKDRLSEGNGIDVVVGNISAGSWGPGNWHAYAKKYGFFGADTIALVISSHDHADNPTFEPLNKNVTEKPISALVEAFTKYFPSNLLQPRSDKNDRVETDLFLPGSDVRETHVALESLRRFLALAKSSSANILVFQHWEKSEIMHGSANPGNQRIKAVCEQLGISPISLEPYFRRSLEGGTNPYSDNIHLNQVGQQLIAEAIHANLPRIAVNKTLSIP